MKNYFKLKENSHKVRRIPDIIIKYQGSYHSFDVIPSTSIEEETGRVSLGFKPLGDNEIASISTLTDGTLLCVGNIKTQDHKIAIIHNPSKTDILVSLYFLLSGQLHYGLEDNPKHIFDSGHNFINLEKENSMINQIASNSIIQFLGIHFSDTEFEKNFTQLQKAGVVRYPIEEYAYTSTSEQLYTFKTTPELMMILDQIKNCPYNGNAKITYLQSKLFELLIVYFDNVNKHIENNNFLSQKLNSNDVKKIDYLIQKLSVIQEERLLLENLAKEIGMSGTDMQSKFKLQTGKTIIQFYKENVFKESLKLIKSGMPIKNVAFACGYSSTAAFSKAFTKFYGLNPSQIITVD